MHVRQRIAEDNRRNFLKTVAADPLALLTLEDLQEWEGEHGRLPERCCVAMNSGWGKKVDSPKFKSLYENGKIRQPAFHVDAANFMIEKRNVIGMAVDTLSLDNQHATNYDVHYRWLGSGRWGGGKRKQP